MEDLKQLFNVLIFTLLIAGVISIITFWSIYLYIWLSERGEKKRC